MFFSDQRLMFMVLEVILSGALDMAVNPTADSITAGVASMRHVGDRFAQQPQPLSGGIAAITLGLPGIPISDRSFTFLSNAVDSLSSRLHSFTIGSSSEFLSFCDCFVAHFTHNAILLLR